MISDLQIKAATAFFLQNYTNFVYTAQHVLKECCAEKNLVKIFFNFSNEDAFDFFYHEIRLKLFAKKTNNKLKLNGKNIIYPR